MAKQSRNQSRGRGNTPARNAADAGTGQEQAKTPTLDSPPTSGMDQEISRKQRKRFGHN